MKSMIYQWKLECFFLSAYLEEPEPSQHLGLHVDPSRSILWTDTKTASSGQGTSGVWSFWTFPRRSWKEADKWSHMRCLLKPHLRSACSTGGQATVSALNPHRHQPSAGPAGTEREPYTGTPCLRVPFRRTANTLCEIHKIACQQWSPESSMHLLFDLVNTTEK